MNNGLLDLIKKSAYNYVGDMHIDDWAKTELAQSRDWIFDGHGLLVPVTDDPFEAYYGTLWMKKNK